MKKLLGLAILCTLFSGDPIKSGHKILNEKTSAQSIHAIYNSEERPSLKKYLDRSMENDGFYEGYFSKNLRTQVQKLKDPENTSEIQNISYDAYIEMRQAEKMFYETWNIEYAKKALACGEVTAALSPNSYGSQAVLRSIELAKELDKLEK